jgi:hypothetical protein
LTVGDESGNGVGSEGQVASFRLQMLDESVAEATELSVQRVVIIGGDRSA